MTRGQWEYLKAYVDKKFYLIKSITFDDGIMVLTSFNVSQYDDSKYGYIDRISPEGKMLNTDCEAVDAYEASKAKG